MSEQLRRYKDGTVDQQIEGDGFDNKCAVYKDEEEEEVDINLQYLNFLEKDTDDIVNELRAKLKDAQEKVMGAKLVLEKERRFNSEASSKAREKYEVNTSGLKKEIVSLKKINRQIRKKSSLTFRSLRSEYRARLKILLRRKQLN